MRIKKETLQYLAGFLSAMLFFAIVRIAAYNIVATPETPFLFYMISQIGCVLIISCWILTVHNRIIDIKVKKLMVYAGYLLILYFFMQMVKYCLFTQASDVCRYMWYGYYVPMTMIPLLVLYILQYLAASAEEDINPRWKLLLIPATVICLGFLTNDCHQLAFYIPNWYENGDKGRELGPVYYAFIVFIAVIVVLGVYYLIRIRKKYNGKKQILYPYIPIIIGIVYMVIYTVKSDWVKFNGHYYFGIAEVFAFMMIGFLEICIQIGIIPSNMGYRKLFAMTGIPARISQNDGGAVYATKGAEKEFEESKDHHIVQTPVAGGVISYDMDLSVLNRLNDELHEATVNLEARNDLLLHENEILEERKRTEASIRIYDRISEQVQTEIRKINQLLATDTEDEEKFREKLMYSAVLNAYVKRRSNMELEMQENGKLPFKELTTAITESLEYFQLSGAETFISSSGEGQCPASQIIRAYRAFENVLEYTLGKVDYMTVRLELNDEIGIRFLLEKNNKLPDFSGFDIDGCRVLYNVEDNDFELLLGIGKGGDI